jgi:hypothetical protein
MNSKDLTGKADEDVAVLSSPAIKQVLIENGFELYSVRKQKRMVGGQRYNFHGGLRQGHCKGRPHYFYQVELLSPASDEDYELATLFLKDAGYDAGYHRFEGLRISVN